MRALFLAAMFGVCTLIGSVAVTSAAGGCGQGAVSFVTPSGRVQTCPLHPNINNCGAHNTTGQFASKGNQTVHICPVAPVGLP